MKGKSEMRLVSAWLCSVLLVAGTAFAQTAEETAAAKETHIDGLRLVNATQMSGPTGKYLAGLGLSLGYTIADTQPGGGKYFCGALQPQSITYVSEQITNALMKMPPAAVTGMGLKYIILCSTAKAGGTVIGGIPVPPLNLLMLNVEGGNARPEHLQSVTLHEYFHLVEYKQNSYSDADWEQRFKGYTHAGVVARGAIGSAGPGFLNQYAATLPGEERAELFATMLLQPYDLLTYIKEKDDKVLLQKVLFINSKTEKMLAFKPLKGGS